MPHENSLTDDFSVLVDKVSRGGRSRIFALPELLNCLLLLGDMLYSYRMAAVTHNGVGSFTTLFLDIVGTKKLIKRDHPKIADVVAQAIGVEIKLEHREGKPVWALFGPVADVIAARNILWLTLDRWTFIAAKNASKIKPSPQKREAQNEYFEDFIIQLKDTLMQGLSGEAYKK